MGTNKTITLRLWNYHFTVLHINTIEPPSPKRTLSTKQQPLPNKPVKANKTFKLKPISIEKERNNCKRKIIQKKTPVYIQTGSSKPLLSDTQTQQIKNTAGVQYEKKMSF